jgi:uncharacterized protein YndB with AHSA1/START domain
MSEVRQQTLIEAPVDVVWEVISDVEHHGDWWPQTVEVECEGLEKGCTYRFVEKLPLGTAERQFMVEELDECHRFRINCMGTGTFVDLTLTEARGETFVDASAGIEPRRARYRVFDVLAGKRYFTRWLEESLAALRRVASERATGKKAAPTSG